MASVKPGRAPLNHGTDAATGAGRGKTLSREALCLWGLLMLASTRLYAIHAVRGELFQPTPDLTYQAAVLGFNYFELGSIRRGLGGSIAYLLSRDPFVAAGLFHLLSAAAVAAVAAWWFARLDAPPLRRGAFLMVMLAIMLRWAEDAGRTDMLVAASIGLASIALARQRLAWAVASLGVGLLVHETAFIFGVPLIVALLMQPGTWASFDAPARLRAAFAFVVSLAAYLALNEWPHADPATMARVVAAKFAPSPYVDWAIYFAISGTRSLATNLCQNANDPSYWLHPTGGVLVLALAGFALSRRLRSEWGPALVATLPAFAFLSVITNDISRWAMFACFNLWLVLIAAHRPGDADAASPRWAFAVALLLLPLTSAKLGVGETPIYSPAPLLERIAQKRFGVPYTPTFHQVLDRCDPTWRDLFGPAAPPATAAPPPR